MCHMLFKFATKKKSWPSSFTNLNIFFFTKLFKASPQEQNVTYWLYSFNTQPQGMNTVSKGELTAEMQRTISCQFAQGKELRNKLWTRPLQNLLFTLRSSTDTQSKMSGAIGNCQTARTAVCILSLASIWKLYPFGQSAVEMHKRWPIRIISEAKMSSIKCMFKF